MKFPTVTAPSRRTDRMTAFAGYNHNLVINEGESYDEKNLTSDNYPVLSNRGQRGVYAAPAACHGLIAKDSLCYVDGKDFAINGKQIDMGLTDGEKTLVSMGAYVIILPDKKYINTADLSDYGPIEAAVTTTGAVKFELCQVAGEVYDVNYAQPTAPAEPQNLEYWIDTSSSPNTLKQYSESAGMWVSVGTTYIKITATGIGKPFEQYDGVDISGLAGVDLVDSSSGDTLEDESVSGIDGSFVVWARDDDYLVITGILNNTRTLSNTVTVTRAMPNMDFVIESENRLWGCRYGAAVNGEIVNELYACKLGDFKNWNCFMGVSTDSYVASVGTDGQWTGAITHLGYPLFFKENCLHKVYGNYPSNYQVQTTACRGVQKGSGKSLAIVGETLYYKSRLGVCAYDGSLPTEISQALGDVAYFDAVAGAHGNKYYISMADSAGTYHLFTYDAMRSYWHKEDNTQADAWCSCRNEMYYVDHADGKIKTINGSGKKDSSKVPWMMETGLLEAYTEERKYLQRLNLRLSAETGARIYVSIEYDSSGVWVPVTSMTSTALRAISIPVRPRRCDHLRLRVEGEGDVKIFALTKEITEGSDRR